MIGILDRLSHRVLDWYLVKRWLGWTLLSEIQYHLFCKPYIESIKREDGDVS